MKQTAPLQTPTVRISQRDPVGWFDPRSLLPTAERALISGLLGERTGRREILAALDTPFEPNAPPLSPRAHGYHDHSNAPCDTDGAFWLDFVADLGDGFNATHSVAWLIGRDYVFVDAPGKKVVQPLPADAFDECGPLALGDKVTALPAGAVLVMGGDQAYPYGSPENYRERFYDPYFAARPWGHVAGSTDPAKNSRPLYAIPGNHDWYDGLTSFIRQFCQPGRWIGCWRTQQRRSYFAIKLPHGIWLWGIDTATEDEIDPPQLGFFEKQSELIAPDERLILVVPTPSWVECHDQQDLPENSRARSWTKLRKIISIVTDRNDLGAQNVPLIISGDLHHYARYEEPCQGSPRHLVTCGLGGAYLLGTVGNSPTLACGDERMAALKATFPSTAESNAQRAGVYWLAWRYKFFNTLLVLSLLATVWIMRGGIAPTGLAQDPPLGVDLMKHYIGVLPRLLTVPSTCMALAAILSLFVAFAKSGAESSHRKWAWATAGLVHGAVQLGVAALIADRMLYVVRGFGGSSLIVDLLGIAATFVLCFAAAGVIFPTYLLASNQIAKLHEQELYSAQAIEQFKGFLRIRITPEAITLYPIGMRDIATQWTLAAQSGSAATATKSGQPENWRSRTSGQLRAATKMLPDFIRDSTLDLEVPDGMSHLFNPSPPLGIHLIEAPVVIPLAALRASQPAQPAHASDHIASPNS